MTTRIEDIDLRKDVLDELERDPSIDARTIGVAVEDGVVALTGHTGSYAEKASAEKIVKRVHGVQGVANDIEVKPDTSLDRDDADIALEAAHALERNVHVPKDRVQVTVRNGWVTLEGDVDGHDQRTAAEDAVFLLAGVRGVDNNIVIASQVHA
jgi:osmotically-inducible protein OsmY